MGALQMKIPEKLTLQDESGRMTTVFLRCDRQYIPRTPQTYCRNCGAASHKQNECQHSKKLCFSCGSDSHLQYQCPMKMNRGFRENDTVYCFRGEKAVLSNFNVNFPIQVDGKKFICDEQYIVYQKAMLFNDKTTAQQVMEMNNPRRMKQLGNNINNYNHRLWQRKSEEIIMHCNMIKYATHPEAMKVLLSTEGKIIGEATEGKEWGIGLPLSDDTCLDSRKWIGLNKMGKILMTIRDNELQRLNMMKSHGGHSNDHLLDTTADLEYGLMLNIINETPPDAQVASKIDQYNADFPLLNNDVGSSKKAAKSQMHQYDRKLSSPFQGTDDYNKAAADEAQSESLTIIHDSEESVTWSDLLPEIGSLAEPTISDCALVIGDSNVRHLVLGEETDYAIEAITEGGLRVSDVTRILNDQPIEPDHDVKVVLIHVGTCDFEKNSNTDIKILYDLYVTMLQEVIQKYQNATLIVSSVLPRAKNNEFQHEFEDVNNEIIQFNEMIRVFCENKSKIVYLDNDETFRSDFEVCVDFYKIHDHSGAHLGRRGQEVLEDVFKKALNDVYYHNKLQEDFDVYVPSM